MDHFLAIKSAIFRTLAYADLFSYPLTFPQLHRRLVASKPFSPASVKRVLAQLLKNKSPIKFSHKLYFFSHRHHLLALRQHRRRQSLKKIILAQNLSLLLSRLPGIRLIALTGAVAVNNANQYDDIDIMIITAKNRLWTTRFIVLFLLSLLGKRRHPDPKMSSSSTSFQDKFCFNLWLDQTSLALSQSQRNLFTAHEVVQIKPLVNKQHTYQAFLAANSWVKNYLPHTQIPRFNSPPQAQNICIFNWLEKAFFTIQYLYMKPKITREKISSSFAFFHPKNTKQQTLDKYRRRLKTLKIHL